MNLEIVLSIMRKFVPITEITLIGGGAKGRLWRQMLADIYGIPVRVPSLLEEATSMGAAVIGGVGAGAFEGFSAVSRFLAIADTVGPRADIAGLYNARKPVFDECYQRLEPVFGKL